MLRLLRPMAFALLVFVASGPSFAQPIRGPDRPEQVPLPELQYVTTAFPPYTMVDRTGSATGPAAQLIAALGERLERIRPLQVVPFARAQAISEGEANVMIALIGRSAEREARYRWICPVLDFDVAMFRRSNRIDIQAETVADLRRWRVAGATEDIKSSYLQRNGVSVVQAPDEIQVLRLLIYGRVDAIPSHPASIMQRVRDLGLHSGTVESFLPLPELTTKLWLAFGTKTTPAVVEAAATACAEMTASGEVELLMQPILQN
jgi:polar amino acid transport system substrate-binding protein